MDVSDMLDVLHYLFESDVDISSREHLEAKSATRKVIYKNIYDVDYIYTYGGGTSSPSYDDYDSSDFVPPSINNEVKPYIPPTNFNPNSPNPFQGALREGPLG